ncbi:MAG: hypothetical protein LWX11_08970 [Firmicutes bacterium]|nr:hypothetical protein [Bacillota bacterium]
MGNTWMCSNSMAVFAALFLMSGSLSAQSDTLRKSEWNAGITLSASIGPEKTDRIHGSGTSRATGATYIGYSRYFMTDWTYRIQLEYKGFDNPKRRIENNVFEPGDQWLVYNDYQSYGIGFQMTNDFKGTDHKAYALGGLSLGWWSKDTFATGPQHSGFRIYQPARPCLVAGVGYRLFRHFSVEGSYHYAFLQKDGVNGFGISNAQWLQMALQFRWGR